MCTAVTCKTDSFYFGRTLDYEFSYGESITIMPRKYRLKFTHSAELDEHYAVIGISHIAKNYPLFYDAANEKGLCAAGLNFNKSAVYSDGMFGRTSVAQFEFIPYVLSQCATLCEAKELLKSVVITKDMFSPEYPAALLHWIIADKSGAVTVEQTYAGLKIYDNYAGVLTNEPPFDMQMQRLCDFMSLSSKQPENTFSKNIPLINYSRGMGAIGLPGDWSSQSRFVRAAFVRANSVPQSGEIDSVGQFFHILSSVSQPKGCCDVGGKYEFTIYSSCCNADEGIYYYTTYQNPQINCVSMHHENIDGENLITFPMQTDCRINRQN